MDATTKTQGDKLSELLEAFEGQLETPVVPGELTTWSDNLHDALEQLQLEVHNHLNNVHPLQFEQIKSEDLGLATRVDQMQETDDEIVERLERVDELAGRVADAADDVDAHESRVEEHLQELVNQGLQLVLTIRRQEKAVTTWKIESLNRDRGVAD